MTLLFSFGRALCALYVKICYHHKGYRSKEIYKGGALLCANHASFLDPPLVGVSWPEPVHFLARDSLFHNRVFGWLIRQTHAHPISRGGADLSSIKTICRLLEEGKKVVIFPEGQRSKDGTLGELKPGVAMIAQKAKCPLIPVYVVGSYAAWPRGRKFPRLKGRTASIYGSPIFLEEYSHMERKEAQKAITLRIQQALLALKAWYEDGAQGTPP